MTANATVELFDEIGVDPGKYTVLMKTVAGSSAMEVVEGPSSTSGFPVSASFTTDGETYIRQVDPFYNTAGTYCFYLVPLTDSAKPVSYTVNYS